MVPSLTHFPSLTFSESDILSESDIRCPTRKSVSDSEKSFIFEKTSRLRKTRSKLDPQIRQTSELNFCFLLSVISIECSLIIKPIIFFSRFGSIFVDLEVGLLFSFNFLLLLRHYQGFTLFLLMYSAYNFRR